MNNIYSCRRIEKLLLRDIHFIWLAGYEKTDFITINRFRHFGKDKITMNFAFFAIVFNIKKNVQKAIKPGIEDIKRILTDFIHTIFTLPNTSGRQKTDFSFFCTLQKESKEKA